MGKFKVGQLVTGYTAAGVVWEIYSEYDDHYIMIRSVKGVLKTQVMMKKNEHRYIEAEKLGRNATT